MFIRQFFLDLLDSIIPGPSNRVILKAINQLKDDMSQALEDIKREIAELTEAQQAVVALVSTNADALAETKAQLEAALAKIAADEATLAEFNGIAAQLDGIEQGLRSVLPAAPVEPTEPQTPETPETPVEPQQPVDTTPVLPEDPAPDAPTGDTPTDQPADGGQPAGDDNQVKP